MDTRILITGTAMGRRSTGIAVTEFITRGHTIGIIATGVNETSEILEPAGGNARRFYFFGDPEAAGADVEVVAGDVSWNSFFKRS